jgi:hypothetical protein
MVSGFSHNTSPTARHLPQTPPSPQQFKVLIQGAMLIQGAGQKAGSF